MQVHVVLVLGELLRRNRDRVLRAIDVVQRTALEAERDLGGRRPALAELAHAMTGAHVGGVAAAAVRVSRTRTWRRLAQYRDQASNGTKHSHMTASTRKCRRTASS